MTAPAAPKDWAAVAPHENALLDAVQAYRAAALLSGGQP